MEMIPVQSSLLGAIGYDEQAQELHVRFNKGGEYIYHGVSKEHHEAMLAAESKGKHFLANVKPHFKHSKKGGQ